MKYIESLREGEKVNEVYLCKFKQAALTKAGKAYDNVILQDKTGTIDAKIWDPGSVGIDEFDALDYVAVTEMSPAFREICRCRSGVHAVFQRRTLILRSIFLVRTRMWRDVCRIDRIY